MLITSRNLLTLTSSALGNNLVRNVVDARTKQLSFSALIIFTPVSNWWEISTSQMGALRSSF